MKRKKTQTVELTQKEIERLVEDALILSATVMLYAPSHAKNAHIAANRVMKKLEFASD